MCFSAEKAAFTEVWEGLSSKSLSDMTLNSCEGRERAGKPRKGWLNELSRKKSLADVHEVKGQNLLDVYVSFVLFKHLWKIVGLSVLGALKKKSLNAATHLTAHSKQPLKLIL